ncbi:H/ACA RNA-protein complex component Gar1 [Methanothermus fervidus DSM 2088]|uniref:H/ACA RNA-protein complex component Gar1 n=1 Tax=Methanothermus fervidus (strain ATCC 43054 / DSM 2088 / JCM 10308 / V24 S) TaxID=523846 RepID=E3GY88_METFV|nr:Gar1/Naf1 family protein [Methanothermus fervidus]ADP77270.1 H/ACA RNA-protein complex component Gar1 [Methanothermus fervidus DSM 2088]
MASIKGKLLKITDKGFLVAKVKMTPAIGSPVYSSDNIKIGNVKRVFGPTKNPYITIDPAINSKKLEKRVGTTIFIKKKKRRREKRK